MELDQYVDMAWRVLLSLSLVISFCATGSRAYAQLDSLRQILVTVPPGPKKVFLLVEMARACQDSLPATAHRYANEAIQMARPLRYDKGIADAEQAIGMTYWHQGENVQAVVHFKKAARIMGNLRDSMGMVRVYNNLGDLYFRKSDFSEALSFFGKSLDIRRQLKDSIGMIFSLNKVADVQLEREQYRAALSYYDQALALGQSLNNQQGVALTHEKKGRLWMRQGLLEKAETSFRMALQVAGSIQKKNQMALNHIHLSELLIRKDSLETATHHLLDAWALAQQAGGIELELKTLRLLAGSFEQRQCFDSAFYFQGVYQQLLMDSIMAEKAHAVRDIQEQYQLEKERADRLESQRQATRPQKALLISLVAALVLLGVFVISRYRYQIKMTKILQEKNREIEEQNESLRQSNQALEQFAYVASHDLREPLRTIGSFSTLLARRYKDKLDHNGRDFIEFVVIGARQMTQLLDDLLTFARLSGKQDVPKESVDLNQTLDQVLSALQGEIKMKNACIQRDHLPTVKANPVQMHQLLQNLISNGLKFNDKDRPLIKVNYHESGPGRHFSIQDNGIGINSRYFEKIFLVFQRLEKQGYTGTGIGLSICEKVIQQHRGKIWVESTEGKGSIFHFTLPDD
ncbi:MAG TPA: tetratricopeptide repeat protein [Saprospiraceae bacterium]|nr:tetratricopeptide repeat protein [Saprospiraceae bacterium]